MLRPHQIVEMVRTGRVVMARGSALATSLERRQRAAAPKPTAEDVSLGSV
jgi:hypothetical protein